MPGILSNLRFALQNRFRLVFLFVPAVLAGGMVQSVSIRGDGARVNLETQAGQPYDAQTVGHDVHRLWSTGRFTDVRVETLEQDGAISVVFRVTPAPVWRLHTVRIEPHSFGLQLKVQPGSSIDTMRAHEMAVEAQKRLQSQGYPGAHVDSSLVPLPHGQANLLLAVHAGKPVDIQSVEFLGETGLSTHELRSALGQMRIRRVFPRIPGIWGGRLLPVYSNAAVDGDLSRLQSLFFSKGYFDATVRTDHVEVTGRLAKIAIAVHAGPRFQVPEWTVSGPGVTTHRHPGAGLWNAGSLCSCLLAAQRNAERAGVLDFAVKMDVQPLSSSPQPAAALTARIEEGQAYRVGRIEFTGNHRYSETNLRRALVLDEGRPLDEYLLRKSLARLNQGMQFEPLDENSVELRRNPETGEANIMFHLKERNRRSWSISGPIGPASFAGPLQGSISSRLPAWGSGIFALSTYTVSFSLLAFANPLVPLLATGSHLVTPILSLQRPFTPGEGWRSGFVISPQLGWPALPASYAANQMRGRLVPLLAGDRGLDPEVTISLDLPQGEGRMQCEPPPPRFAMLRTAATMAVQFVGSLVGSL